MSTDVRFFGGIDWASETHQVCLVATDGKIIGERAFAHGGAGLAEMCDWLVTTSGEEPPKIAVAIEVPHGPIVEILLERRFQVDGDCPEFRVWFGHNGKKGDIPWPDARNPRSQMLFLISFLVALIPRRPLIRTAFWTI